MKAITYFGYKMKRITSLLIMFLVSIAVYSQATDLVVDCQTPGWLSSKINYGDQQTVKNLKVTGYINSQDLKFIGELIINYNLNEKVDLSEVNVVNNSLDNNCFGVSSYSTVNLKCLSLPQTVEKLNSILPYSRLHSRELAINIDTLYFNCNVNYIDAYMFGADQYAEMPHHIIIGEKVETIPENAFMEKKGIISVIMPINLKYIGERAFFQNGCSVEKTNINELKNLKYLGVGAFPGYQPDTLIVPKSLDNPFNLFSISTKDGQHIYIDDNINTVSGAALQYAKPIGASYTTSKLFFHINNPTPPSLISYKGLNSDTNLSTSTVYVPKGAKQAYLNSDWKNSTIIEVTPTYTLSVTAIGNGSASYNGTTIRGKKSSFEVEEGSSANFTFSPDNGYRIKSVRLNNSDVTSSVSNNKYTISSIGGDTTVEVEFEAKPTCTLTISASGNGSAIFEETSIRNETKNFVVFLGDNYFVHPQTDTGYELKTVKLYENDVFVRSSVPAYDYHIENINTNTRLEFEFSTNYNLSIKVKGNGSVSYNGTSIQNNTSSFNVKEGKSATITFTPDGGYRIKSVMVNSTDVTSSVSNNSYTINNISSETSVEVEFEAIPPTTYTLSIKATGNGSATYEGTIIKNKTNTFTVTEGTSATITFTPDNGYRIMSVKVGSTDVTSKLSSNKYTISSISGDTSVEVEFEVIPPTTYTLSIKATGNGSVSYDGTAIRGKTSSFTVTEGTSATITFTPDNGYRIKIVKVNSTDVTSSVSNNKYLISNISGNIIVEVEFEVIPPTTYTLSISAIGNGSASYDGTTIRNKTSTFTVNEGSSASISFTPDNGYRIKSVKENNTNVTSYVSNNEYVVEVISRNTEIEVEFEAIPPTTYTLFIKVTGNGSAYYGGTTVRNKVSSFTISEGTSATITFTPDNGYQIKSVVVDGNDVTSYVYNDGYTINNIKSDITAEVEFEAIPPTTYTLSIKATGNGSASYDGTTIRGETSTFTVNEGTSASITFSSDNGYRIKSVKVNNSDVTTSVSNSSYTVKNISRDTDVEVGFEAIPVTTYKLSITSTGNGSASYEGTMVKNKTTTFTVNEGASATITFTPDNGYRIKSVKVNNTDVTSSVSNNKYTISNINKNTTVEVEFEVIPPTVYILSIKATGNGSVTYDGTSVRSKTSSFNVNGGSSATITISPDDGNRIKSVIVNSSDVTSRVMNNSYTISNISGNTTVEVVFEEIISELTYEGVYYEVVSETQQTVKVVSGDYGLALNVPASFTAKDKNWKVVGVEADVLSNPELAAIIWNPEVAFSGKVNNPNLLLYVKEKKYGPNDINNVIVNGVAENIMLQDAEDGNNFYCPQAFTAKRISYIHRYGMKTGFNDCQGWETIVLPFDVITILSATGTEIVPYNAWQQASNSRPFWLYSMNSDGWKAESGIKANMPYIISMPNNEEYDVSYNLSGDIQFMSSNVQVIPSGNLSASKYGNKQFVPNYQNKVASQDIYALNVNNQWNTNTSTKTEGSAFIRSLRQVRPFEAYLTIEGGAGARGVIPVFEDGSANGIPTIPVSIDRRSDAIYNLNGQRVNSMSRGIYIQNGKKIIKK